MVAAGFSAATRKYFKERCQVSNPFVFVDLLKFLPDYCSNHAEWDADDAGKERLTMLQWVVAYDRYAIAAIVAGEMSFASASAHKDVGLQVRCSCFVSVPCVGVAVLGVCCRKGKDVFSQFHL